MAKTTFTYIHPTQGPIQHKVEKVLHLTFDGPTVSLRFSDDKGRELQITTNQPFVHRVEEEAPSAGTPAQS